MLLLFIITFNNCKKRNPLQISTLSTKLLVLRNFQNDISAKSEFTVLGTFLGCCINLYMYMNWLYIYIKYIISQFSNNNRSWLQRTNYKSSWKNNTLPNQSVTSSKGHLLEIKYHYKELHLVKNFSKVSFLRKR